MKRCNFTLDADTLAKIDTISHMLKMNKSEVIRASIHYFNKVVDAAYSDFINEATDKWRDKFHQLK